MKLSECLVGVPVKADTGMNNNIGHIVGFSLNSTKEVIVDVKLARGHNKDSGNVQAIPPANLSRLKD